MLFIAAALPLLTLAAATANAKPVDLPARDEPAPPPQVILHVTKETSININGQNFYPSDTMPRLALTKYTPEQAARKLSMYAEQSRTGVEQIVMPGLTKATYPGVFADVDKYEMLDGERAQTSFKIKTPEMADSVYCAVERKDFSKKWGDNAQTKTVEYDFKEYDWWTMDGIDNNELERLIPPVDGKGDDAIRIRCRNPKKAEA